MNRINLVFLIAFVPVAVFVLWFLNGGSILPFEPREAGSRTLYIENLPVSVEIADTPRERERGLSGRTSLPPTSGLLFIFDELGAHGIWMKGMHFPIDIIWIAPAGGASADEEGEVLRIVDIKRDARPESYPKIFYPRRNALYVLEVNANFTEIHGIEVGDTVRF